MRVLYVFMTVTTRYELAIARKYSDNRGYIARLSRDLTEWEGLLLKHDAGRRGLG